MFVLMLVVGINDPARGTSVKGWCYQWLVIALIFDGIAVFSIFYQNIILTELLLGISAGAATVLGVHVAHHLQEEKQGIVHEH